MPRATWVQTSFNSGEWSPLAYGRFDLAKYKNGVSLLKNFLATQQGGLTRRSGTRFVAGVKDNSYAPRLVKFEFGIEQAYVMELGDHYARFYADDGQLVLGWGQPPWDGATTYSHGAYVLRSGGTYVSIADANLNNDPAASSGWWYLLSGRSPSGAVVVEIPTNYTIAEVWESSFQQLNDTVYMAHPNHPQQKIQRIGASVFGVSQVSFIISDISFLDGPYLGMNITSTSLTPDGTVGTVNVVASSIVGINGGAGFRSADVGRQLRIKCGGVWLWGLIASVSSTTQITWAIDPPSGVRLPSTAVGVANVSGGSVFSVTVTDGGGGYGAAPPSVTISPHPSDPATATATVSGGAVTALTLTHAGSGYNAGLAPQQVAVSISGGGGSGATGFAGSSTGSVFAISLVNGGAGYTSAPTVTIDGGGVGGSGAVAYASLTEGVVTAVVMSVTGTSYTSAPDVIFSAPANIVASSTAFWRLGIWNSVDGYPSAVAFHQDRLSWGGAAGSPGRVDASNSGDYENMAPTNLDGTVVDSNALAFDLAGKVNHIQWMQSDENGLLVGTAGGEWIVAASGVQQAITPTNVNAKVMSNYGSAFIEPIRVGKATLFIQRTGRKVRELFYQFTFNTFQAQDISLVGEHLTKSGLKQLALQLAPQQIVWFVRNDGTLVGMTYDKDQDIVGWHQHALGGFSDAAHTLPPMVESVAVIPEPGITRDEPWLVVQRYVNGVVFRSVERLTKLWEDGDVLQDAAFLDSSAEYTGTAATHITGLDWLVGETVGVLAAGAVHPNKVVQSAGGVNFIDLDYAATPVQIGFRYNSQIRTLSIEAGGADGPSQGKFKRVFRVVLRFFQTLGLNIGSSAEGVGSYPMAFRSTEDPMDAAPPLFSGDQRESYEGTQEMDSRIFFETDDPTPCNITLLMAQLDTQDGA